MPRKNVKKYTVPYNLRVDGKFMEDVEAIRLAEARDGQLLTGADVIRNAVATIAAQRRKTEKAQHR